MRRFGWQIGGLSLAIGAVVALAVFAVAGGSGGSRSVRAGAFVSPTARATPTADARVAAVEATVRRYVEAVEASARTGDPNPVDALVVPGSQAQGNAGIASGISHSNGYNFISSRIDYQSWQTTVNLQTATVTIAYSLFGHVADWPSLRAREADHESQPITLHLDLQLMSGTWLVEQSS